MPFAKFLTRSKRSNTQGSYSNKLSIEELINAESALGRTVFGPIPEGHQREFFEAKKNVWLWYEKWLDATGAVQEMTVRYEVRPTGVYKKATGSDYTKIEGDELNNFRQAVSSYLRVIKEKLYY